MSPDDPRHGTYAGYQAHRKAGELACQPCLKANAEYGQRLREFNPNVKRRARETVRAQNRAKQRLSELHRAEYTRLYIEALDEIRGVTP